MFLETLLKLDFGSFKCLHSLVRMNESKIKTRLWEEMKNYRLTFLNPATLSFADQPFQKLIEPFRTMFTADFRFFVMFSSDPNKIKYGATELKRFLMSCRQNVELKITNKHHENVEKLFSATFRTLYEISCFLTDTHNVTYPTWHIWDKNWLLGDDFTGTTVL